MHAIVPTLARITKEGKDTSRPVRLELLARLKEIAAPDERGLLHLYYYDKDLEVYLSDPDPLVAKAAADMYGVLRGKRPTPTPRRQRLSQPSEGELFDLPRCAIIDFGLGTDITVELLVDEAPLTIAQFVRLARDGYYDKQMFYRVLPLNLLQIGSPRPNDYMGYGRYLRDEIGPRRHTYGTLGMWSAGPDTSDAQFFFNMSEAPLRNYKYTVFGEVGAGHRKGLEVRGMEILEDLIEGARIATIRPNPKACVLSR
jgi:cyclophilin family peptidyl-prolyl cis-trans isomerase